MTRPLRFLTVTNSSSTTTGGTVTSATKTTNSKSNEPQPELATVDSDFVVILASLLCALICVLGLIAVARCAWLRRLSSNSASQQRQQPPSSAAVANKGLKKKVLRSLPKQTFSPESAPKFSDCAICLTEFLAGDEIRVLPQCGHGFHVSCIDTWLGSHSSCPSCRQILVFTRCQKCGGLPASSSTSSAANSNGGESNGNGGGETESRLKEREDGGNRFFLP